MKRVLLGSSEFDLEGLQACQEVERGEGRGEFDGRVEKGRRTFRTSNGVGLVDLRAKERTRTFMEAEETEARLLEKMQPVPKVGSQGDAGSHGFWFKRRHAAKDWGPLRFWWWGCSGSAGILPAVVRILRTTFRGTGQDARFTKVRVF
jgi:hypothetical protein